MIGARIGAIIGARIASAFGTGANPLAPDASTGPVTGIMIAGQSNAHGRANPTLLDPGVDGTAIYSLATIDTADSFSWPASVVPRRDLQPFGAGVPGMGVELSLGRFCIDAEISDAVLPMSKMGVDGSLIATWRNSTNLANFNTYWSTQESDTGKLISDLVWIQGEADAINPTLSGLYLSELTALMADILAAHPGLKRIHIVQLNAAATGAAITPADRAVVRAAQASWVASNPGVGYLVNVDGVSLDPADNVHYLANGYWAMGQLIGMSLLGAVGAVLPVEVAGVAPYIRKHRATMFHTSVVSGTVLVTPSVANVGELQCIWVAANVQGVATVLDDAQGFAIVGASVDSNAAGVHIIGTLYERIYDGTQGSPIVNTGVTQNRRGIVPFTVARGGAVDASASSVTNALVTAVTIPAVTTLVNNSLVVYLYAGYSGTDSTLSSIAASGLADEVVVQNSRISNSSKCYIIAGTLPAFGSSGTCTATASVNTNQARMTISVPPA